MVGGFLVVKKLRTLNNVFFIRRPSSLKRELWGSDSFHLFCFTSDPHLKRSQKCLIG